MPLKAPSIARRPSISICFALMVWGLPVLKSATFVSLKPVVPVAGWPAGAGAPTK